MKKQHKEKLEKKAFGYYVSETSKEYGLIDGKLTLLKQKVTRKHIPPDIAACNLLEEPNADNLDNMSDEELENERQRLLKELAEQSQEEDT